LYDVFGSRSSINMLSFDQATSYTIQLNKFSPIFDDPDIERTGLTKESIFIDDLEPNTSYNWRVIAHTEDLGDVYSETREFRTGDFSSVPNVWDSSNEIIVFPNPNSGKFTIDLSNVEDIEKIEISDLNGNIIDVNKEITGKEYALEIKEFNSGMHFIKFYSKDKVFIKKINLMK
jgi:hypothetical protein